MQLSDLFSSQDIRATLECVFKTIKPLGMTAKCSPNNPNTLDIQSFPLYVSFLVPCEASCLKSGKVQAFAETREKEPDSFVPMKANEDTRLYYW